MEQYAWLAAGGVVGWALCAAVTRNELNLGHTAHGTATSGLDYKPKSKQDYRDPATYADMEARKLTKGLGISGGEDETMRREPMDIGHLQKRSRLPNALEGTL